MVVINGELTRTNGNHEQHGHETVPSHLQPEVYSCREIIPVQLGLIINSLNQARPDTNPQLSKLKESIRSSDLINEPEVAVYDDQLRLREYVDFINEVWRGDDSPEDLPCDSQGRYYVTIDGHSRIEAITQLARERAETAAAHGHTTDPGATLIPCKTFYNPSPEEIISRQLAENIHQQVPRERQAMALVETYMYGLKTNRWHNQAEFSRHTAFPEKSVREALLFSELPPHIRDHVFLNKFPYLGAVELARSARVRVDYELFTNFGNRNIEELSDEEKAALNQGLHDWLGYEVAAAQEKNLNATAIQKRLQAAREKWQEAMEGTRASDPALFMVDPMEEYDAERRRLRSEYHELVQRLAADPLHDWSRLVQLHQELYADGGGMRQLTANLHSYIEQLDNNGATQETLDLDSLRLRLGRTAIE